MDVCPHPTHTPAYFSPCSLDVLGLGSPFWSKAVVDLRVFWPGMNWERWAAASPARVREVMVMTAPQPSLAKSPPPESTESVAEASLAPKMASPPPITSQARSAHENDDTGLPWKKFPEHRELTAAPITSPMSNVNAQTASRLSRYLQRD